MLRRTAMGLDRDDFRRRTGFDIDALAGPAIERYRAIGYLEDDGGRLRLSREGIFVADQVLADFCESASKASSSIEVGETHRRNASVGGFTLSNRLLPDRLSTLPQPLGAGGEVEDGGLEQAAGVGAGRAIGFGEAFGLGPGDDLVDLPGHQLEHLVDRGRRRRRPARPGRRRGHRGRRRARRTRAPGFSTASAGSALAPPRAGPVAFIVRRSRSAGSSSPPACLLSRGSRSFSSFGRPAVV